ncbi:diacylglycerol kinase family protein [Sphingobium sp. WTD-1]|uniref:diacylglycerol kinase family protein n=1 Tax=Sphingobium sp. WTD-1 TaxID=2979467 RepID=UPI0024DEEB16|nr:diacylglycerol kinase family protein [Sphingobium sp. WTD-1]WIA54457.1 diacylglycerol kinase family protein [Sphingobium sp. WTD-1]
MHEYEAMICCALFAALLTLTCWPWRRLLSRRASPLAWRPDATLMNGPSHPGFSLSARARSIGYAVEGLWYLVRHEHNAWIHLAASAAAIGAGLMLHISLSDWRWLILSIGLVWAAEAGNTAIEQLCNLVHQARHPTVKRVKDVAAGAVLLCAIAAAAIGAMTLGGVDKFRLDVGFPQSPTHLGSARQWRA